MTEEEKLALDYSYKVEPFMDVGIDNGISVYCRQDVEQAYLDGYLAGLEAGRPKWHKVADGDLPKEQKEYWCKIFFYESEETFNAFLWFDPNTKDFKFLEEIEENVVSTFNVKEWCELPIFEV